MALFDDLVPGNDKPTGPAPTGGLFGDLIPQEQSGDFMRGAKVALGQTVPILKGVVGLAGATAENALGEGGISTAVKNWGLKGYTEGMDKLQPMQRDTDELTTAWDKAKGGDLGALVDWVQYGLGYAAGQGGEAVLTSLVGGLAGGAISGGVGAAPGALAGLVAKGAVKDAAVSLIQKAVLKEANNLVAQSGGKLAAEEAVKQATKSVAKNIGSTSALLAYGGAQELGSIYPEAEAEAAKQGRKLDGADLARVWASGIIAGGVEGLTDKLGVEAALGKVRIPGASSRLGQAGLNAVGGIATEATTEGLQTGIERVGAGQEVFSDEGWKDIINSAGLGAIGGGAIGGGAGLIHGAHPAPLGIDPLARKRSDDAFDAIADAKSADEAIAAFEQTHIPLKVPENFDAEGAMARMQRARDNDESMLRDRNDSTPAVVAGVATPTPTIDAASPAAVVDATVNGGEVPAAATVSPAGQRQTELSGFPPTAPARAVQPPSETFQERLAVVREKLQDSRTRQQIRDLSGSQALGDALYFAKSADDDTLPGKTSDAMLEHAERLLKDAGVPALPRQIQAKEKADTLEAKRAAAQAKIDADNKTKETVAPSRQKQELDAAAAAPGAGLKAPETGTTTRQKAALLTGDAMVNEQGLLEPLPKVETATGPAIDEAAHAAAPSPKNDLPEPTQAQKEAGNYQKGHARIGTLDLSIENPEGSTRSGVSPEGKKWTNTLAHHYGYIKGTIGNDKEHVDAFVKPGTKSDYAGPVFIVDQNHVDGGKRTGRFDEHKALIGFADMEEAKAAYRANYAKGWDGMQSISAMPMAEFERWVKDGPKNAPLVPASLKERAALASARTAAPAAPVAEVATNSAPQPVSTVTTPTEGKTEAPAAPAQEVDLGPTVKHTTGKGKEIHGWVLQGATDAEARAIDAYTFKKDGGYFIRERHQDALEAFEQTRAAPADTPVTPQVDSKKTAPVGESKGLKEARDNSPVVLFGRELAAAGMEFSGNNPRDWSESVGERGEIHAEMHQGRGDQPTTYSVRSMQDGKDFSSLSTAKLSDVGPAVKEQRAALLAEEKPGNVATEEAPKSLKERAEAMKERAQGDDKFLDDAEKFVRSENTANPAALQRRMSIGYNRAQRIMEQLEMRGVVGPMAANGERKVIGTEAKTAPTAPAAPSLTMHFGEQIRAGNMPKDNPALKKMVEAFDGKPPTQSRMKEAQETLEAAIVKESRRLVHEAGDTRAKFDKLLALYQSQPLLNVRTSTSIENQAYSTPAPLALLASDLAGINGQTTVLEPTAGTGMLLIEAAPSKVIANELEPLRLSLLREQGFAKVTDRDATERVTPIMVDRVITNPPFGPLTETIKTPAKLGARVTNSDGSYYNPVIKEATSETKNTFVKVDGYKIGQIDHLIAARALESMKDNGRATLIIGANKVAGGVSSQDLVFFNWLYGHYNVTSHFEVDGKLYERQGAGWPVRVITIEGREKSAKISPAAGVVQRAMNWDEAYGLYEQGLATGRAGRGLQATPSSAQAAGPDVTQPLPEPARSEAPAADRRGPEGREGSPADVAGQRTEPVGDSGAVPAQPVGQRDSAQRPGNGADRPDRLDGDAGRAGTGEPAGNSRVARVAPKENALTPVENEFQAQYTPRSSRKDAGVLIPVNMQQPTQDALSALEDAVGDIDEYARKQLGYDTTEQMHEALMGLQVDSVASAIYQIGREKGTIIADQTGIGKGRQAAAIIRWAVKNGRIPVFASVKPSLFTDMYGDLHDIGTDDVNPLIMNLTESIKGAGDEKLFANKPSSHKKTLESVAQSGMLPEGRNALFMTYSQINVDNMQRRVVEALAPRAIFVLDESHNAGGDSNTGNFIKAMLDLGKGVVYLSATYAKRPDNMPLYYKTDMGEAVADDDTLMNAMEAGGLPLQTVVSNNLVKAGQMFRRERSFDGVEIRTETDTANRELHEKQSDAATEALRGIVAADRLFHEIYFKERKKEADKEGARALEAGNGAAESVNHTEFSSVVHNFVRQMLLGLEANKAADLAIASLQQGQKPLIALENTMGSFLTEYADANKIRPGDALGTFDYRNVLSRALERTRYVTIVKPNGDKVKEYIPLSALDGVTLQAYTVAQEVIDGLKLDIPVSPIDWMRDRLAKAGFSVAEITGRTLMVDYSDTKTPKLAAMDATEVKDKVRTTRQFNSGKLDAIILNVAGSTGISLHASEKFTDQRQRMMIVAQAAQDINIFMQMLGRIHRTGQVALPAYKLLNADLPAVKRPTALLSKKMKSLNANTSSNTESATSVQAFDMLNKYGDQVVGQYLADNPLLARELGLQGTEATEEEGADGAEDIARKATGRLALLPVEQQRAVYADLEQQYGDLIDFLNRTNQNDLEPRTMDLDARELNSATIFEGQNPATPFGQDAIYNEYSIKAQGKPMTPDEVRAETREHLGEFKTGEGHAAALVKSLNDQMPAFLSRLDEAQKVDAMNVYRKAAAFMQSHQIGAAFRIEVNGEPYVAVVTNLRSSHKSAGNPFSMSKIQVTLAVNGALRHITVPATKFQSIETSTVARQYNLDSLFREGPKDERQVAKIITGNLLGAYGELKGVRGSIISFTKEDGTTEQGILLPKAFTMAQNTAGDYRLPTGEAAVLFLRRSINKDIGRFGIQTRDGIVRVVPDTGGIVVRVPKSKAKGGKWFLDEKIRAAAGGDFISKGNAMELYVNEPDAAAVLDLVMKKQALYTLPSMAEEARNIVGPNVKPGTAQVQSITNPDRGTSQQAQLDPSKRVLQNAGSAANWLAGNGSEGWVREVASKLTPFLDADTRIKFLKAGESYALPKAVADAFRKGGIFGLNEVDPITGRGSMYLKYDGDRNPVGESDLLHELVHAATQRALSITKSATIRAELESIRSVLGRTFDQVLTSPRASESARNDAEFFRRVMEDEHELLAYGLTSPTFRKWAQSIDATGRIIKKTEAPDQGPAPKLTMWQRFVDAVRSLIGLTKMYAPRLDALLSRREAERLAFRTADTPETLATRLDSLLQQTLDLRVGPQEYADNWTPGRDKKLDLAAGTAEVFNTLRSGDQKEIRNLFLDATTSHSSVGLWEKTVGTQYAKAQKHPLTFGRVFNALQDYVKDTSVFANAAADRAPDILPKLDKMTDLWKDGLLEHGAKREDVDAAGNAAFAGTLRWSRDENGGLVDNDAAIEKADALSTDQKARVLFKAGLVTEAELKRWQATPLDIYDGAVRNRYEQKLLRPGVVFSDAELKSLFKMSPHQIDLYRQFRATVDQSLDDLGRSELVRLAGKTVGAAVSRAAQGADTMSEAAALISEQLDKMTEAQSNADAREQLTQLRNDVNDKANRVDQLKTEGYAPLMRFGEHTVDVVGKDGERLYFGMFESGMAANKAARAMRDEFPQATVTQGKMSQEAFKLYQGLDLNALELFASQTGNADNAVYQDFLRLTKNNRSAMKRLIERKGVQGFNENTRRVLASFVTSNARMASGNLHMGEALSAANDIPKEQGDLKDEATKLIKYVQNPGEEATALRGLLFTTFIGGSAASAMVNLTQPFTMSLPYLSQFGGIANAGKHLLAATKAAAGGKVSNEDLRKALHDNPDIVSPQEIHHLNAATQDRLADHPLLKKAAFVWGSMFSLSEQFNRRVTFIAAWNTATEQGMANPVEFARKAVIETQGLYNKGNKPNWARGAIGATVMTFKQFSIHYLEFLTRMYKSGPEGKKAVAVALAILVLTAGAGGLPFADDLDDLIDTLAQAMGYDFSSKKAKREFVAKTLGLGDGAAEFLTRGVSGIAGVPIDVSLRMSMGNLVPGTGALLRSNTDRSRDVLEVAGAAGGLAKNAMDAGTALLSGQVAKAGMTVMPMAIQNIAKAAQMFNTGEYRNAKGQKVLNVDAADAAAKFIGFNPAEVAKESSRMNETQRSVQLAKNVESEIAGKWAQGLNDNDPDAVRAARAELADWNEKNGNTMRVSMQQVISRVREMRASRADRTIKAAPREMRQAVREGLN